MIKKIFIGLSAVLAIILVIAAGQPDTYVIERVANVNAAPEVVYAHITDQRDWQRSNPWVLEDPTAKAAFTGESGAIGSTYSWTGEQVGKGTATLVEARPFSYAKASLHFIEPFESMAVDEYLLEPAAGGTKVTHKMSGENDYIGKLLGLFMSMDAMIGGNFEKEFELMNKNLTTAGQ